MAAQRRVKKGPPSNTFPFAPEEKQLQVPSVSNVGLGLLPLQDSPAPGSTQQLPARPTLAKRISGLKSQAVLALINSPSPSNQNPSNPTSNNDPSGTHPRRLQPLSGPAGPKLNLDLYNLENGPTPVNAPTGNKPRSQVRGGVRGGKPNKLPTPGQGVSKAATPRRASQGGVKNGRPTSQRSSTPLTPTNKNILPTINPYERLLGGCLDNLPPQRTAEVRIFLSSTFSDFKVERNALFNSAQPQLKEFCGGLGLDFQMLDMRWGVGDDANNDHQVEQLCLSEIEHCQKLSQGPNFVAMVGNRFGFQPIPVEIDASEFELLRETADKLQLEGRVLMDTWYKKDCNAVPPLYILQPINTKLPHFIDHTPGNEELRRSDITKWNTVSARLQQVLRTSVHDAVHQNTISNQSSQKYFMSVTEQEIKHGILRVASPNTSTFCILRKLTGLKEGLKEDLIGKFVDTNKNDQGSIVIQQDIQDRIAKFASESIPGVLDSSNIMAFTIPWRSGGVGPESHDVHDKYIAKFVDRFVAQVKKQVDDYKQKLDSDILRECRTAEMMGGISKPGNKGKVKVKTKAATTPFAQHGYHSADILKGFVAVSEIKQAYKNLDDSTPSTAMSAVDKKRIGLHAEILTHLLKCQQLTEVYLGREAELNHARTWLINRNQVAPLVIHSDTGVGKTSFVAMVIRKTREWLGEGCVTVVRFLGTTPNSSSLRLLLCSLTLHLSIAYGLEHRVDETRRMAKLVKYFHELLLYISLQYSRQRPLVIVLVSLDQLTQTDGAHTLSWLPKVVPAGVQMVLSLIPEQHDGLNSLQRIYGKNLELIELENLPNVEVQKYVEGYMTANCRTLTEAQLQTVVGKLCLNPNPLIMKMVVREALKWRSYTPLSDIIIAETITVAVTSLFQNQEVKYGAVFIRAALGYLTVAQGLTVIELEDALSCNDAVLNEIYQYHNPPIQGVVRVPPLFWARVYNDLRHKFVERVVFKKTVVWWYNRHYIQVATDRYAAGDVGRQLHADLAQLFMAQDTVHKTIALTQRRIIMEDADRQVTIQPMTDKNVRMLMSLPFHLIHCGDIAMLKSRCWFHLPYIQVFIKAFSAWELISEVGRYVDMCDSVKNDPEIQILYSFFRFSHRPMHADAYGLQTQVLGQLLKYTDTYSNIKQLCDQACDSLVANSQTCLIPRLGSMPSYSATLKWYMTGPSAVLATTADQSKLVLQVGAAQGEKAIYKVLNTAALDEGRIFRQASLKDMGAPVQVVVSSCQSSVFVYVLFKEWVQVYHSQTGERLGRFSTDINHGGHLNCCLAVCPNDQQVALGSGDRMALMENASTSTDEVHFQVKHVMNMTAATDTTNFLFGQNLTHSISSHTIKGQKRSIGALVTWQFEQKALLAKVPLPSPIPAGFMYALPPLAEHDIILCGCNTGEIFIVDMQVGKVVVELKYNLANLTKPLLLSSFSLRAHTLITGVKGHSTVCVWDVDMSHAGQLATFTLEDFKVKAVHMAKSGSYAFVSDSSGKMLIIDVEQRKELKVFEADCDAVRHLVSDDRDQLFTVSRQGALKLWDVEGLTAPPGERELDNASVSHTGAPLLAEESVLGFCAVSTESGDLVFTGSPNGLRSWTYSEEEGKFSFKTGFLEGSTVSQVAMVLFNTKVVAMATLPETTSLHVIGWKDGSLETIGNFDNRNIRDLYVINDTDIVVIQEQTDTVWVLTVLDLRELTISKQVNFDLQGATEPKITAILSDLKFIVLMVKENSKMMAKAIEISTGNVFTCKFHEKMCINPGIQNKEVFSLAKMDEDTVVVGCHGDALLWKPPQELCIQAQQENVRNWLRHTKVIQKGGDDGEKIPVTAVTISEDRKLYVTGAQNGSIVLWRKKDEKMMDVAKPGFHLKGHKSRVTSLCLSPNLALLVSSSDDRTIRLWSVPQRSQLTAVNVHLPVSDLHLAVGHTRVLAMGSDAETRRLFVLDIVATNSKFFVTEH